jgi:hypothetical protein
MTTRFRIQEEYFCTYNSLYSFVRVSDDTFFPLCSSAHYDSVSTGFGVTDDGIGVVSLLQLVEHLVKNRPRRTAIFNINDGEEDGLNGAQAFVYYFHLNTF